MSNHPLADKPAPQDLLVESISFEKNTIHASPTSPPWQSGLVSDQRSQRNVAALRVQ